MPTGTQGQARIDVAAPPGVVYALVADVTRMGRWSPECYHCEWVDGATGPEVGARFRGHNRLGPARWRTTAVVTVAEPGREFAFAVLGADDREQTRWRYTFTPTESGTEVVESYRFLWCPLINRIAELPVPRDRQLRRGLRHTLERIKAAAESAPHAAAG